MSLTTTVTPEEIAVALGRETPTGVVAAQWQMWIDDALMLIDTRATAEGGTPDQTKLDYVVREAVVAHVKKPDDATQVTVAVDDGSSSRTYRSGNGRVTILDEWWELLGLVATLKRAFEIDLIPASSPFYVGPS